MRWQHVAHPQLVLFGEQAADEVGAVLRTLGLRRVVLVSSSGRLEAEAGQRVRRHLGRALVATFDGARPHVPASVVQQALVVVRREGADGIVSLGGGSCVDLAKAVAEFTEMAAGQRGTGILDRPLLPHVAVPTTYAGAAYTPWFGVTDDRTGVKGGGASPTITPVAVVADPTLALDLPTAVAAGSAAGALAACADVLGSPGRTPEAEALALAAARHLGAAIPALADDPDDEVARHQALTAAVLAGRASVNAHDGLHATVARLLGGRTGLADGLVSAALLPSVVGAMASEAPHAAARLGDALGDPDDPAGAVHRLLERCGLPASLDALAVADDDLDMVVRLTERHPRLGGGVARALLDAAR